MVMAPILPLHLTGACVAKRGQRIIGPIDLEVGETGITIVIGPNGSGKTSLLRLMHGMERAADGAVRWQVSEAEARRRQAYVFQTPIMMRRTVLDNVAYPLRIHGTPRTEAAERAKAWVDRLGLQQATGRQATVLSGGEKQKLALARALIRRPDIVFLDEPCANLDGRATRDIETILHDAHGDGTRIIMATHDMGQARRLATDVIFMYRGRLHETAAADSFFDDPATREARAFLNGDILE